MKNNMDQTELYSLIAKAEGQLGYKASSNYLKFYNLSKHEHVAVGDPLGMHFDLKERIVNLKSAITTWRSQLDEHQHS